MASVNTYKMCALSDRQFFVRQEHDHNCTQMKYLMQEENNRDLPYSVSPC